MIHISQSKVLNLVFWSSLAFKGYVDFFADILAMVLVAISQYLKFSGGYLLPLLMYPEQQLMVSSDTKPMPFSGLLLASSFLSVLQSATLYTHIPELV